MTKVVYYITTNKENPVSDFLDSLTSSQQAKILRIIFYYVNLQQDSVLLLHGFMKKSQKTPVKEIENALYRLRDWLSE
ncbi:MAG: type II toxin-antitoxin system RelE/ParE family toxin [Candidatus Daviesbacteria bacterium]|nr:type II toxin-antitoxin system RelE/ParE family toxin [Candidatus Daviesbacteria bacterium]